MADDDGMTQREKRAQRHKVESRKEAPGRVLRKAAVPALLILLVAAVAAGFWYTNANKPDCPTHWHGSFGVFIPSDADPGRPEEVNFRSQYYDISGGRQPERAHSHFGDGFNQMHFEQAGTCVGVQEFMRYVEVRMDGDSIELFGHHEALGQGGTWEESGNQTMHAWLEVQKDGAWVWEERSVKSILDYQLKDGEKVLVYLGDFSDEEVDQMKASIRDPVSREAGFEAPTGHPTTSATHTNTTA